MKKANFMFRIVIIGELILISDNHDYIHLTIETTSHIVKPINYDVCMM